MAVDRERTARGHRGAPGAIEEDRAHHRELELKKARRGVGARGLEGVRAHELGEVAGMVRGRKRVRAHLVQADAHATVGELAGALAAGKAAPDDVDHDRLHIRTPLSVIYLQHCARTACVRGARFSSAQNVRQEVVRSALEP